MKHGDVPDSVAALVRSAVLYERGNGKAFCFQPGHESYPTYYNENVQTVIKNAVCFVAPTYRATVTCHHVRTVNDEKYVI